MKRREVIRSIVLVSAGAAFLYQCKEKAATIALKNIPLTGPEQDLMTELTEFILPSTDLRNADFILMMADDCLSPELQEKFQSGMKAFTEKGFIKMSPTERDQYVNALDGDAKIFYQMVKQGTIENFTSSENYLKEVKNITSLIPSKFQACVAVNHNI
jgi:hypothetical protein